MIFNRKEVGFARDLKYSKPKMGSVVFFFPCGIITATVNPVIQQVINFNYLHESDWCDPLFAFGELRHEDFAKMYFDFEIRVWAGRDWGF